MKTNICIYSNIENKNWYIGGSGIKCDGAKIIGSFIIDRIESNLIIR